MVETSTRFEMEADLLIHLLQAVDRIEKKLDSLDNSTTESMWITSDDFSQLVGTSKEGLKKAVYRGKIYGDAIRNIGTAKRATFRFHRTKAVDQYLKKLPTT